MNCTHCGSPVEPGSRFCPACGTPLVNINETDPAGQTPIRPVENGTARREVNNHPLPLILSLIGIVLSGLGAAFGILLFWLSILGLGFGIAGVVAAKKTVKAHQTPGGMIVAGKIIGRLAIILSALYLTLLGAYLLLLSFG